MSCSLKSVSEVVNKVDKSVRTHVLSGQHTRRSDEEDLQKLVTLLIEEGVFQYVPGR